MKPWYYRRRLWTVALLLLTIYFCLVPSRLRISPETTGYTDPLTPSGDVDYFGVYEKTYIDKLSPPEDNGQRLLIAACGPGVLEQLAMVDAVPWEELPTHPTSKQWFEEQWIPLCEHMYIDPYAKPRFLDSREFYGFLRREWEKTKKEGDSYNTGLAQERWNQLVSAPWTAAEHPDVARWLEERSPVLDLFGVAVRKPNFVCWRWRNDVLYTVTLPDVQANRAFGRDLRVRVTERLGRGDIDGAWYDVMSAFYLSQKHYVNQPFFVINLLGFAVEGVGWESAKIVLQHGKPTSEQLERFANELAALPRKRVVDATFETTIVYSMLMGRRPGLLKQTVFGDEQSAHSFELFDLLFYLPFDRNIAGKRVAEFNSIERRKSGDSSWNITPLLAKKHFQHREESLRKKHRQLNSPWSLLRVPLIRTRSQMIADYFIELCSPALNAVQDALDRSNAQFDLLRVAVALERFHLAEGSYPLSLAELVPTYLDEVPLDAFTGRQTLTYRLSPPSGREFLLYSFGPNGLDDAGTPPQPNNENWAKCDIVW